MSMRVTALVACHDRRELTLACLDSYFAQEVPEGVRLEVILVDDGCTDGTAESVSDRFEQVRILRGDGTLYWAGATAWAEREAWGSGTDHVLWLNDDVVLDRSAVRELLETSGEGGRIAVGALRDPDTGAVTYSAVRRPGRHPIIVEPITPTGSPLPAEMFHGNVVLVPAAAARVVGPIDAGLVHTSADFDYGLRARRLGVEALLCSRPLGTCGRHPIAEIWLDAPMSLPERLRFFLGPKGYPPMTRARWLRRHGGRAWPVWWLAPYIRSPPRLALRRIQDRFRRLD